MARATSGTESRIDTQRNDSSQFAGETKELYQKTADKMSEYLDSASLNLKKLETSLREGVKERPLLVLGGALLAGYLAGFLVKKMSSPARSDSDLLSH